MPSDKDDIHRWLILATWTRALAAETADSATREIMLKIADGYEHLARIVEKRQKSSS